MKKLISLVLAIMMIGLVGLAFAEDPVNNRTADGSISISGLDAGDNAKFYQVLKFSDAANTTGGWTNAEGFNLTTEQIQTILGLDSEGKPVTITDDNRSSYGISSTLAGIIANDAKDATAKYTVPAAATGEEGKYGASQANPDAGLYVIIVVAGKPGIVYNPVFVGADYDRNTTNAWAIDMSQTYADNAMAKKDDITVTKVATDYTHDNNEVVEFTITTKIPEFADNYTNPIFNVYDKLSDGLDLLIDGEHTFTVSTGADAYTGNPAPVNGADNFKLEFKADYIKGLTADTDVIIHYYAKVVNPALYNVNPDTNEVTVQYSNNPDSNSDYGLIKDRTNHYTFSLDANIFGSTEYEGSEIVKVGVDKNGNILTNTTKYSNNTTVSPLEGAHFKLTTDQAGNNVYTNNLIDGADITSLANGKFTIKGLDEGTYYLTEISAPAGYVKSTTVYEIVITANMSDDNQVVTETDSSTGKAIQVTYKTKVLNSYSVVITPIDGDTRGTAVTSTFTMNNDAAQKISTVTPGDVTTPITNTQGVELPSTGGIGTTIFYIVGGMLLVGAAIVLVARRKASN